MEKKWKTSCKDVILVQRTIMAERRVKIGKEFNHIPAVMVGNGWLRLEKGKFANVRFDKTKGKLELTKPENGKRKRVYYSVEDYAKANEDARKANKIGEQAGASFGSLRKEEEAALKLWREYVEQETQAGTPPRKLTEIMRELIERERTKDETPLFEDVALQFLEHKERRGGLSVSYSVQMKSRLAALSKTIGKKRLSEINESMLEKAIAEVVVARGGESLAPKTLKHWLSLAREVFSWWFKRENATRPARERLTNPLEALALPKIEKEAEPEILTLAQARSLLSDLAQNALELIPIVAAQMFAGVRNSEALRLRWRDIRGGEIVLSCSITKTKVSRVTPVSDNLQKWFAFYAVVRGSVPAADELIFSPTCKRGKRELSTLSKESRKRVEYEGEQARRDAYGRALRAAFKRAGIAKEQNAFRHTAASCLVRIHGEAAAASYCGHSIRTQGVFYRTAVSKQDAKDYFNIMPPTGDGKAIAFDRSRGETIAVGKDGAGQGNAIPKIDVANA